MNGPASNQECLIMGYWYRLYIFENNNFWKTFPSIFKEHQNSLLHESYFNDFIDFHDLSRIDYEDFDRIHEYFVDYCNSIENIQNQFKFL